MDSLLPFGAVLDRSPVLSPMLASTMLSNVPSLGQLMGAGALDGSPHLGFASQMPPHLNVAGELGGASMEELMAFLDQDAMAADLSPLGPPHRMGGAGASLPPGGGGGGSLGGSLNGSVKEGNVFGFLAGMGMSNPHAGAVEADAAAAFAASAAAAVSEQLSAHNASGPLSKRPRLNARPSKLGQEASTSLSQRTLSSGSGSSESAASASHSWQAKASHGLGVPLQPTRTDQSDRSLSSERTVSSSVGRSSSGTESVGGSVDRPTDHATCKQQCGSSEGGGTSQPSLTTTGRVRKVPKRLEDGVSSFVDQQQQQQQAALSPARRKRLLSEEPVF